MCVHVCVGECVRACVIMCECACVCMCDVCVSVPVCACVMWYCCVQVEETDKEREERLNNWEKFLEGSTGDEVREFPLTLAAHLYTTYTASKNVKCQLPVHVLRLSQCLANMNS